MWKRLVPARWARIVSWTGAAVVWGTTAVVASEAFLTPELSPPPAIEPLGEEVEGAVMPTPPEAGLVVLRYRPVPPPPPEEIVRTVVVGNAAPIVSSGS